MALALFDLDNTLLNGDSDHAWGIYLADIGAVDKDEQKQKQDFFYQQYVDGVLDIFDFCEYQFKILKDTPREKLESWRADFMHDVIEPIVVSGKSELLEPHRAQKDTLIIITATNDFITAPIAERLGVKHLIATQAQCVNGKFTGKVDGTPCFQEGKITRLIEWMGEHGGSLENSTFYSDSYNDLPLLEAATTPIVVTPDDKLREHAKSLHWKIID